MVSWNVLCELSSSAEVYTAAYIRNEVAIKLYPARRAATIDSMHTLRAEVARIRAMLASDDTEFVAVGIGHLGGPDSLLTQLRAGGLAVERVP
jgi:uncharacterized protein YbaP (TraB family)